jgi:hypothetical protein
MLDIDPFVAFIVFLAVGDEDVVILSINNAGHLKYIYSYLNQC